LRLFDGEGFGACEHQAIVFLVLILTTT
jgi:hypothetical protein